jgi:hypothetical protein
MKMRKRMTKRKRKRRRKRRNPDHLLEPRLVLRRRTINPNPLQTPRRLTINQSLPRRTISPLQRKRTINPNLPVNPNLPRKTRRSQSRLVRLKPMINLNLLGNRNLHPRRMRRNQSLLERRIQLVRNPSLLERRMLRVRSPSLLERERRMIRPREIRRRPRLRCMGWMERVESRELAEWSKGNCRVSCRIICQEVHSYHMAVPPSLGRKATFL